MLSLKHVSTLSDRVACLLTVLALEIFQFPLPACSSMCWNLLASPSQKSAITVLQLNWLMQRLHYLHLPPNTKPTDPSGPDTFPLVFVARLSSWYYTAGNSDNDPSTVIQKRRDYDVWSTGVSPFHFHRWVC